MLFVSALMFSMIDLHERHFHPMANKKISIEVAYVSESKTFLKSLIVEQGTSVIDAIALSGLCLEFPDLNLELVKLGIFSEIVTGDDVVKEFDRVEVYRPLLVDPKQARRLRAAAQKKPDPGSGS